MIILDVAGPGLLVVGIGILIFYIAIAMIPIYIAIQFIKWYKNKKS